ncbi:hypothetical protein LEP1GSC050_2258 [Leptospira broomii serovar Hurstbridge str. 5399]|uniref:Uncharacterized protein n=1 Tax=Leptospira broomii serovar Hurstbridge str. 5399 TaxID=1049789 RepID=T0F433_9LEPT|nr:hypothetical protein [Leptospira broomii]EQA45880.1 hypothetical protein LEP1GSC050_2258 [Leptospira broomii serovar Hurstbridge str. 5399]
MADDFRINKGKNLPEGSEDEFDPNEMSLDDIDSLLSSGDDSSAFDFDSIPVTETSDPGGFEELLASSGEEYPTAFGDLEPAQDFTDNDLSINLNELDEEVHLDEDFDFELTDPLIDAEIDRLLDIEEEEDSNTSTEATAPSWKDTAAASSTATDLESKSSTENAFSDLGSLDLGDFSQPGEVPSSAFHSDDEPFETDEHETGFGDLELEDETPISLSDDELQDINISANLADFDMEEEESEDSVGPTATHPIEDEFLSDDEGPISLSDNELGDLLGEAPQTIESHETVDNAFADIGGDDFPVSGSTHSTLEEPNEEGDIALSIDELDHLLTDEGTTSEIDFGPDIIASEEPQSTAGWADFEPSSEEPTPVIAEDFSLEVPEQNLLSEEDSDEPIALSDDELGDLLSSGSEEPSDSLSLNDLEIPEEEIQGAEMDFAIGEPEEELLGEPIASDFDFGADLEAPTISDEEETISLPVSEFSDFTIPEDENDPFAARVLDEVEDTDVIPPGSDFLTHEDESEEPIALSDDELGDLLSSGEEEASVPATTPDFLSEEEDSDEPIALSDDELGDLLSSGEEETAEVSAEPDFGDLSFSDIGDGEETERLTKEMDLLSDEEADEPIALSDNELGDLLSSADEAIPVAANEPDFFADADEPIALSEDELGNLLSEEGKEESTSEFMSEEEDEGGPIALPVNELDELGMSSEPKTDYDIDWDGPVADLNELSEVKTAAPSDWDLGEEADEPITLSDDELGNLLADEEPRGMEVGELDALLSEPPPASDLDALGATGDEALIADLNFSEKESHLDTVPTVEALPPDPELLIVLDEFADEGELSPIEEIRQTAAPASEGAPAGAEGGEVQPSQEEMKRILLYLDELLGNLPDDMIREFSRSDYFELYKKLMKQIGV